MSNNASLNHPKDQNFALTLLYLIATGIGFGVLMALVTNAFVIGVGKISQIREASDWMQISVLGAELSLTPLFSMLIAAGLILVIRRIFVIGRWHGPADSIYAAHRTDNELDARAGFGSTIAAFISASGGASVGQYGPLVHFGATVGSFIRQLTHGRLSTDIFIGCGVASAIAAGFNAPIAGVVFAHEAILRHFSFKSVAPIAVASITSAGVSKWIFGDSHTFSGLPNINLVEVLPFALITGPMFGIVAAVYMTGLRSGTQMATKTSLNPTKMLLVAALIIGSVGMFLPQVLGLGTSVVLDILSVKFGLALLLTIMVAKAVLTAISLSLGFYGGIFSPAIFVGAAAGASLQKILAASGIYVTAPVMVVCGMAAVASAVIGAPISGVLIILEMTMSYEYALAAMLSVVTATLVSHHLYGHSFFDRQLLDRGIDISQGRSHLEMMEIPISELVTDQYVTASRNDTKYQLINRMVEANASESYLIDNNIFIGKITLHKLLEISEKSQISKATEENPISIKHDASLMQAIEIASEFVGESIPVINREKGTLVGVVTEGDIFQRYLNTQSQITDLEKS